MFIDTHAHLYDERFNPDQAAMVGRMLDSGVGRCYLPNCNSSTIDAMHSIADAFPDALIPMMGLHPCYVKEDFEKELQLVEQWLEKRRYAAIGEIGLDFYWDKTHVAQQEIAFRRQIDLAARYSLPIVIHSRESTEECIAIVREAKQTHPTLRGIFHCYAGTVEQAVAIAALDFLIGIGGVVTYKNAGSLHDVVKSMPLESMVLETDAPYLPPVPHRGKRNESSYIPLIAQRIADLKEIPLSDVENATTAAAQNIFSL